MKVGDELLVDGGMVRFEVIEKIGPDVKCLCTDPGLLLPRANLTFWRDGSLVRERNAMLPTVSSKVGSSHYSFVVSLIHVANLKLITSACMKCPFLKIDSLSPSLGRLKWLFSALLSGLTSSAGFIGFLNSPVITLDHLINML